MIEVIVVGDREVPVRSSAIFCGRVVMTPEEPLVLRDGSFSKDEIEAAMRSLEGGEALIAPLLEALDFG